MEDFNTIGEQVVFMSSLVGGRRDRMHVAETGCMWPVLLEQMPQKEMCHNCDSICIDITISCVQVG